MADKDDQPPSAQGAPAQGAPAQRAPAQGAPPQRPPARAVPPPFAGPLRTGPLAPRTRADRLTLPPFAVPFAARTTPPAPPPTPRRAPPAAPPRPPAPAETPRAEARAWLSAEPNETTGVPAATADVGAEWRNPDEPAAPAPSQAATGIAWLDSPEPQPAPSATAAQEDADDPFGWDPAEERGTALDAPPTPSSLDALKEVEPWAVPGAEAPTTGEDVAAALERIAARIRSGDLLVPGATGAASDEALLAAVLATLLQRAHG